MRAAILPSNWCEATFEDVLADISNGISDSQNKEAEGIPVSRIETIATGKVNLAKVGYVSSISEDAAERYLLNPGDILFSHINSPAHIGKTAIFLSGRLYHGTNVLRIRTQRDICTPEYFEYYCRYFRSTGEFSMNAQHAVNQSSLNQKKIKAFTLPLPPLAEQTRIAQKLDELLAQVDTLKARIDAIPALLKRFRQSTLATAVSGRLTEEWRAQNLSLTSLHTSDAETSIGFAWPEVSLGDVAQDFSYGSSAKSKPSGDTPVLRMGNIQGGRLDWGDLVFSTDQEEIKKYALHAGDVLFNRTNSPELVGKTAIYKGERPAIYAGYLIRVRCSEQLNADFLNYCLNSPQGKHYCWQVKTDGVSQSNINAKKLAAFRFGLPSIEEQTEIVRRVEQLFAFTDQLEAKVTSAKSRIDHLTQSILAKAFRGELVPQDPNDEPASVLLERIKTQRTAAPKAKRGRKTSA